MRGATKSRWGLESSVICCSYKSESLLKKKCKSTLNTCKLSIFDKLFVSLCLNIFCKNLNKRVKPWCRLCTSKYSNIVQKLLVFSELVKGLYLMEDFFRVILRCLKNKMRVNPLYDIYRLYLYGAYGRLTRP